MATIENILSRLEKVARSGEGYKACCPHHDDSTPSLSVTEGREGIVLQCWGGCTTEEVLSSLGLEWSDLFYDSKPKTVSGTVRERVTLARLAEKFMLPIWYLEEELSMEEEGDRVVVPYFDREGERLYRKFRVKLSGKEKYSYPTGEVSKAGGQKPYGLWRLDQMLENGWKPHLFLVEGESDVWALWRHGVSALGIPGASAFKCLEYSYVDGFEQIYIVEEPGTAGAEFAQKMGAHLRKLGFDGVIKIVKLPTKDACDLHVQVSGDNAKFLQQLRAAVKEALDWSENKFQRMTFKLSDVKREKLRFLWHPYIPVGVVTLWAGKPGLGKSILMAEICAVVTAGKAFPEKEPFGVSKKVLLFAAEDDPATILKMRMEAVGADDSKIEMFNLDDYDFQFGNEEHYKDLEGLIEFHKPALIIFDPLVTFVDARVDINKANEVRALLKPLGRIARKHGIAVVVVAHVKKGNVAAAVDAVMGSLDFVAAARSAVVVTKDPEDPEGRVMAHAKYNITKPGPSLRFRIVEHGEESLRLVWEGLSPYSADELAALSMTPEDRVLISDAERFLREELAGGPRIADDLWKIAKRYGIQQQHMMGARKKLNIVLGKYGDDWCLGYEKDLNPPQESLETPIEQEIRSENSENLPFDDGPPY